MEPFKNNISPQLVACIAFHLDKHLGEFKNDEFQSKIVTRLEKLELKQRTKLIADEMHAWLPKNTKTRNRILLDLLHPYKDASAELQSDKDGIRGWGMLPLCAVVGEYGLDDFQASLAVLKEMTKLFSSEFDVRNFLLIDQEFALSLMASWVNDPCHHVRRLVSEGTRPRLPWGVRLPQLVADPSPTLPLLEALRDDEDDYVRRSVANHLNDIAKDHPDLVARLAKRWMRGADKKRIKMLRHACRTLIKQGHPLALEVFGFSTPLIKLKHLTIQTPDVSFGEGVDFSMEIKSTSNVAQSLIVDYLLHFRKSNGKLAAKVFKWTTFSLEPKASIVLGRSHAIRPITTRKYYAGQQGLSLRINGQDHGYETFSLCI